MDIPNFLSLCHHPQIQYTDDQIYTILKIINNNYVFHTDNKIYNLFIGLVYEHIHKKYARAVHYYNLANELIYVYDCYTKQIHIFCDNCNINYRCIDIESSKKENIVKIINGRLFDTNDDIYNLFIGLHYECIKQDYNNAHKYYLKAIDHKNSHAMNRLGGLFQFRLLKYDIAIYYYLMAIEYNNLFAMFNLAQLYEKHWFDYDLAKKYYLMAIEHKHSLAMFNLGLLYEHKLINSKEAEKYYLMAIYHDKLQAIYNLLDLYILRLKQYEKYYAFINYCIRNFNNNDYNNYVHLIHCYFTRINNKYIQSIYIKKTINLQTVMFIGII